MKRIIIAITALATLLGCARVEKYETFEDSFVNITGVIPDVVLAMRYYCTYIFV